MSSWRALASSVRLNQPNQFASSSSPRTWAAVKPAPLHQPLQLGGVERVDVDDRLERVFGLLVPGGPPSTGRARTTRRHSGAVRSAARLGQAAMRSP